MAYCSTAQVQQLIDARILGDLVNDQGQRVSPSGLLTDPNLILALSVAAGQINTAALVSERYTVAQLQALSGDDANILVMLNAWLAIGILCSRRGRDAKTEHPEYVRALEMLTELRSGAAIFNVPANVAAGIPSTNFPTAVDLTTVNNLTAQVVNYYPTFVPQNVPAPGT